MCMFFPALVNAYATDMRDILARVWRIALLEIRRTVVTSFVSIAGTWKRSGKLNSGTRVKYDRGWVWLPFNADISPCISRNYSRNSVTQPSLHHLTGRYLDGATEIRISALQPFYFVGPDYRTNHHIIFSAAPSSKFEPIPTKTRLPMVQPGGASPCDQQ